MKISEFCYKYRVVGLVGLLHQWVDLMKRTIFCFKRNGVFHQCGWSCRYWLFCKNHEVLQHEANLSKIAVF